MSKQKRAPISFDEMCRFNVEFRGEIGSAAHREHHLTLMAKLGAKAFVAERRVSKVARARVS